MQTRFQLSRLKTLGFEVSTYEGELNLWIGFGFFGVHIKTIDLDLRPNMAALEKAASDIGCYNYELDWTDDRRTGLMLWLEGLDEASLTLNLWDSSDWHRDRPKFRHFPFCEGCSFRYELADLMGGRIYQELETGPRKAFDISLPEGDYRAYVFWRRVKYGWRVWPRTGYRYEVEPECGIPIPGKGENSWDCGDTTRQSGTMPMTTCANGHEKAASDFRNGILETREQRGGPNWSPFMSGFLLKSMTGEAPTEIVAGSGGGLIEKVNPKFKNLRSAFGRKNFDGPPDHIAEAGRWVCECCGQSPNPSDPGWFWDGETWMHAHRDGSQNPANKS